MSLGYCGMCLKQADDSEMAIYSYAGENWNDDGKSQSGDCMLQDGVIVIYKRCLEEPEIHEKVKRMPSGRKKLVTKRITHYPSIGDHIRAGDIIIEKECKNAFRRPSYMPIDYIANKLLPKIFISYQENGALPEKEIFII